VYTSPISITGTSMVRAMACKEGWLSTNVDTHTYLFVSDIITQPANPGGGWPNSGQYINTQEFDFGMDPDVVNDTAYTSLMDDALLDIATISIVTDLGNLLDPSTGIYVNATGNGIAWERPISLELINPDGSVADPNGSKGFQIDAGLRIRGGGSRKGTFPKHAFRLFFRAEYGAGKLNYPLFGDEGVSEFDKVDLRATQQYSWTSWTAAGEQATFNRDVFSRDTQRDMRQPYTRSRYYHLYLNGIYWGLYQSQERPEARYAASYFGGVKEDYDVVKVNSGVIADNPVEWSTFDLEATDGTLSAWYRLWDEADLGLRSDVDYNYVQGLNADGSPNPAYEKMLDADNLIDYMQIIYFGGNIDSPSSWFFGDNRPNNFYLIYNRNNPDGFIHFMHDAEYVLDDQRVLEHLQVAR